MTPLTADQVLALQDRYASLRLAVVGDYALDRYLEIDASKSEVSIETDKEVHNVIKVRSQPGAAGTILGNLVALGIGELIPVGFCGQDGEGFELLRALSNTPGVNLDHFIQTPDRVTFTYTKPLLMRDGAIPEELNRLDFKNWTPTPRNLEDQLAASLATLAPRVDGVMILDQVDIEDTGVVTSGFLNRARPIFENHPALPVMADSRRGLNGFPPVIFKMNLEELNRLSESGDPSDQTSPAARAKRLSQRNGKPVFITMAADGILGAGPNGDIEQSPIHPIRGPIDIVGAGDSVSANLIAAFAAGLPMATALQLANAAASIVIHKVGTTGGASLHEIADLLSQET